ncbi:MAG TPA: hypothetical protein VFT01_11285 [Homoserinimonas sp.]|nr:hypothetical protein [Homoserinimonas sp.]
MQPRSIAPALLVVFTGLLIAAWVSVGRLLFGVAGELTQLYTFTLGLLIVVLHAFIAEALARTAQNGHRTRRATIWMLATSWACGILLGLMIPDVTALGLQTILTGPHEPGLSIAIGVANPLGIIMLVTAIVALALARGDARGKAHVVEED